MTRFKDVSLKPQEERALEEVPRRVAQLYEVDKIVLYGSVARGEADEESDLDLLIVTAKPLTRTERHKITDLVFEVNLEFGTNLSTLVVDRETWESGLFSVLPIHDEINREGILL